MKPSWISLSIMAVILLMFAFYKTVVKDAVVENFQTAVASGSNVAVASGSNVAIATGSNVAITSAVEAPAPDDFEDVGIERTENLITSNIPIYLSTFDKYTLEYLTKSVVWRNTGALRNDSNIQFRFATIPSVNKVEGILINQPLTGPSTDKIAASLGAMSVAMIFRTNGVMEAAASSNDIPRINLLQIDANTTNNIGLQVSLTEGASKDFMRLNIRWADQLKLYTVPRIPLEFGYTLLVVSNNNATIVPYVYSLSLDSMIPIALEKDATTTGQVLSISNRPLMIFKDCKGKGVHRLRMFMLSTQPMTEVDVKLLATRYLEEVNTRFNQVKVTAEKRFQVAENLIAIMKKEVEDARTSCWNTWRPLPYMDPVWAPQTTSTEDELDVE